MGIGFALALLGIAAVAAASPAQAKTKIARIDYQGWKDCYELSNPLVRMVVVPQIGGRVMEYSIRGQNVMWRNPVELGVVKPQDIGKVWHNYGGHKAWNAPQAGWRAPDYDNFYDYAPAKVEEIAPGEGDERMAGIRLTLQPVAHQGFQLVREIYLSANTSRVRLIETMRNVSDREIEWSIWSVTQADIPCWIAFPLHVTPRDPQGWRRLLREEEYPDPHQVTRVGDVGVVRYTGAIDKLGTGSPEGWLVYLRDQLAYVKKWSVRTAGVTYPDDGCNAQIFTADKAMGGYVEVEALGPITRLKPGESTTLVEDWFLTLLNQKAEDPEDVVERLTLLRKRGLLPRSAPL